MVVACAVAEADVVVVVVVVAAEDEVVVVDVDSRLAEGANTHAVRPKIIWRACLAGGWSSEGVNPRKKVGPQKEACTMKSSEWR